MTVLSKSSGLGWTTLSLDDASSAQQAIKSAQSAREAPLEAGGGFAATARGVRGAGSASTEGAPV